MRAKASAVLGLVAIVCGACRDDASGDAEADDGVPFLSATAGDTGESGESEDTSSVVIVPGEATDLCEDAYAIGAGKHFGTLRGRQPELGGACGLGGPDAFFRLEIPARSDVWLQAFGAGFQPRVGVLPNGCVPEWTERQLACTQTIGTWLTDIAAGASLVVSVGIDDDDPALQVPPPESGGDPLDFRLDVVLSDVLDVGQACEPKSRGRCGPGTACLSDADGDPAVCTTLEADTCATAQPVPLALGSTLVEIPADAIHSDAHAHSCVGERRPERVLALALPATEEVPHVVVTTSAPDVGLALRGGECDLASELACDSDSSASGGGAQVAADLPPSVARPVLLFVELPPAALDAGEEAPIPAPIEIHIELTTPG